MVWISVGRFQDFERTSGSNFELFYGIDRSPVPGLGLIAENKEPPVLVFDIFSAVDSSGFMPVLKWQTPYSKNASKMKKMNVDEEMNFPTGLHFVRADFSMIFLSEEKLSEFLRPKH